MVESCPYVVCATVNSSTNKEVCSAPMFCPKCGKEIPDDSQFCLKCGHTLAAASASVPTVAPAPARSKAPARAFIGTLVLGFLIAIIVWQNMPASNSANGPVARIPFVTQAHNQQIANGAVTIGAARYLWYKLDVPNGATDVSIDGHFTATGGMGNDVEVYVLNADSFVNFQNHHSAATNYSSGKVTQSTFMARLPSGGTYYLVLNNNFSLLSPKAIQIQATLHYTN